MAVDEISLSLALCPQCSDCFILPSFSMTDDRHFLRRGFGEIHPNPFPPIIHRLVPAIIEIQFEEYMYQEEVINKGIGNSQFLFLKNTM